MNSRLNKMIVDGKLPLADGMWIDDYNQSVNPDCAGTILAGYSYRNHYFVMEELNAMPDGTSRTIKRQYGCTSRANLERSDALAASGASNGYRIRKLTPRECFRLMGVAEPDIDTLLRAGISNSQLYKLAGNSIVVNCMAAIFYQLFIGNTNTNQQLELF